MPTVVEAYPLSPIQEGILSHGLFPRRPGAYTGHLVCSLQESLNVPAFQQAWQEVVDRHPVLRTAICGESPEGPLQEVHAHIRVSIPLEDWRGVPKQEHVSRLETFLRADGQLGFPLATGPSLRFALFRLADADYQFVWTFHRALLDDRSIFLVLKEVFAFYEASAANQTLDLEPPQPYLDFIHWISRRDWSAPAQFWQRTLEGFTAPTSLTALASLGLVGRGEEGEGAQEISLGAETCGLLNALAARHDFTLNTFVLGAWAVLLSRVAREEDVVFGTTYSCRRSTVAGAQSMVGALTNILPMRVRIPQDARLVPWLQALRAQQIAVGDHGHSPLLKVQSWSQVPRGVPLFDTLVLEGDDLLAAQLRSQGGNLLGRQFQIREQTNCVAALYISGNSEVVLGMRYDRERFDAATVGRMLGWVRTLLEAMAQDSDRLVRQLSLVTEPERKQLLVDWNQTKTDYPSAVCVHELFEAQVERTPANVAVAFQGQDLTYRELNRRANLLAHHLRQLGVGPDVLVGICLERSLEMVVGLLGILKAGGAFVPLDPTYPKDRLAFMLEDSEVPVLLSQHRLLHKLPAHGGRTVLLEADQSIGAGESDANPSPTAKAENLAYVMYTSGSTGKPKGVLIVHRGLVNYLLWCLEAYRVDSGSGAPVHSSIGFDLTITALFAPLLAGRTVFLLPESHGLEALCAEVKAQTNLSLVKITPSHLQLLSERLGPADVADRIRRLIIGGENLMADTLGFWQDFASNTVLINEYGPTETVVGSCVYQVPPGKKETGAVPIGRPIANTQTYVLDPQGQLVPVGVSGELYLAGAGLARGYLKRPRLTAERFVPHPFSNDPTARLYKTGDLVRWRPDGNLEFLGRVDHQVKLRGFRIELEEIEAVLCLHPKVRQAVVLLREDRPGSQRLVGYVVPQNSVEVPATELRAFLMEKLPEYMLPTAFVKLDALPLTPNGKVDRRALPAPQGTRHEFANDYHSPRTPLEEEMAALWAELLGVGRVGVLDNFFALGGDSLLAVKLFARIEKQFRRALPLAVLFQQGTIAGLAELLAEPGVPTAQAVAVVALQPGSRSRRPMFLMPSLGGELLFARLLINHLGDDTAVYGLQPILAAENRERFVDFEATAAQQVQAIRLFQPQGPYALAGYSYGGILAYEVARQLVALGEEVDLVALLDACPPSEGPPPKPDLSARRAAARLQNFFHWIVDDALASPPRDLWQRAQRKLKSFLRRWSRERGNRTAPAELEDVFDLHLIMAQNRELMATIWKAFREYVPRAYSGRVVLIRARTQPIFDNAEPDLGWGTLAEGGVEVHVVPGNHESILTEPHVRRVAQVLKRALDSRTPG